MIEDKDIEKRIETIVKTRIVEDNEFGSLLREVLGFSSIEAARKRYPTTLENH